MPSPVAWLLSVAVGGVIIGGPVAYSSYLNSHFRNFRVVEDGVLYRSGQLSEHGLKSLIERYGIKTVISLRAARTPGEPHPEQAEEDFLKAQGIQFIRLIPKVWSVHEGGVPADENVATFLNVMDDPSNYPVLIHCFAGIHRTGTFCAIYRMEYHRWSTAEALAELRTLGYDNIEEHDDVVSYLKNYQPRSAKPPGR